MPFKSLKPSTSKMNLAGRQEQINNLRVFNNNVVETVPLRLYEVSFTTETGVNLSLSIHLPDKFPNIKPLVEVNPPVIHPWVDILGTVDSPGLRNFAQHSDLGMVIQAIRREFDKTGVQPADRLASKNTSTAPGVSVAPSKNKAQHQIEENSPESHHLMQTVRNKMEDLSLEELKSILNEDDHFEKFILQLETEDKNLVSLNECNEQLRENLAAQAKENQKLQRQIDTSRNEIICNYEAFHKKKSELKETLDKLNEMNARIQPSILSEKLLELSHHCDEESDEIAEQFLQKEINVETFLPRYIQSRGAGYLKKIKADKVKKLPSEAP